MVELKAYAKVNPVLNVGPVREDGYHEVSLLMASVDLYDVISMEKSLDEKVQLETEFPYGGSFDIPDEKNLAVRAARLMQQHYGLSGVRIHLQKNIPMAAGMAGGSADAAAVINGMDRLFELGLSVEERRSLGAMLGSDVPFCITGGTALCTGRGEKVTLLKDIPAWLVLVVKPSFGVSTPWAYQHMVTDETENPGADMEAAIKALQDNDLCAFMDQMKNQLAPAVIGQYPLIGEIIGEMERSGAEKAMMTGSGPSVFGLFKDEKDLTEAAEALERFLAERDPGARVIGTKFLPAD